MYKNGTLLLLILTLPPYHTYSPEGPVKTVPALAGALNTGAPLELHCMTSAIVYLVESQAPAELASALKVFQICVPSGEVKNLFRKSVPSLRMFSRKINIPIATRAIVSICTAQYRASLAPRSTLGRICDAIPSQ
jgi:hypothetical protein